MATRDWVNKLAGSTRMLGHGQLYTGKGNLYYIEEQIERFRPDCWKGYNIARAAKVDFDPNSDMRRWALDDPEVAYPTYEKIDEYARKDPDVSSSSTPASGTCPSTRACRPPPSAATRCWVTRVIFRGPRATGRSSTSSSTTLASSRVSGF